MEAFTRTIHALQKIPIESVCVKVTDRFHLQLSSLGANARCLPTSKHAFNQGASRCRISGISEIDEFVLHLRPVVLQPSVARLVEGPLAPAGGTAHATREHDDDKQQHEPPSRRANDNRQIHAVRARV